MIAYTPRSPLSGEPPFREVTFELDGCRLRPSSKVFESPMVGLACFSPVDLAAVEALTGRPVLMFPYGFYTRALAEAASGQPAKRLLELLIETGLACPTHGPSPYGEYCGFDPSCEEEPNRRARMWRARFAPRRRSTDGVYVGVSTDRSARVELAPGKRPPADPSLWPSRAGSGLGLRRVRCRGWRDVHPGRLSRVPAATATPRAVRERGRFEFGRRRIHSPHLRARRVVRGCKSSTAARVGRSGRAGRERLARGHRKRNGSLDRKRAAGSWVDVYEPRCNAVVPPWKRADHRLHGMLHASLLSALDCCSMLVIPHDGGESCKGRRLRSPCNTPSNIPTCRP